jgi:hypothetical protein
VQKSLGGFDDEEAAVWANLKAAIEHDRWNQLKYELPETAPAELAQQRESSRFQGVSRNTEYDPEVEVLPECAQSLESGEPGELVGCQVMCLVDPYGWCPGVLSEYITKGRFKDHSKVRLRSMYVLYMQYA